MSDDSDPTPAGFNPADLPDEPGHPQGASELGDVVGRMAGYGYAEDFTAELEGGSALLRCTACDAASPAADFRRAWTVRLEGASDPDDMMHVSALRCPACGAGGAFVSPFGANVGEADEAVLLALPEAEGPPPARPD